MKITVTNNCYSKYKENLCIKYLKKHARRLLSKENLSKIKSFNIIMVKRYTKGRFNASNVYGHMWDDGNAEIMLSPEWIIDKHRAGWHEYGVMHELVHLRDILDGRLISEKPHKGEQMRVWYQTDNDDYLHLYTKTMPEWVSNELYAKDEHAHRSFIDHVSVYYPWERNALTVS